MCVLIAVMTKPSSITWRLLFTMHYKVENSSVKFQIHFNGSLIQLPHSSIQNGYWLILHLFFQIELLLLF